jgi:hypothetical protein
MPGTKEDGNRSVWRSGITRAVRGDRDHGRCLRIVQTGRGTELVSWGEIEVLQEAKQAGAGQSEASEGSMVMHGSPNE